MSESKQYSAHLKSKPSVWVVGFAVLAIVFGGFMIAIAPAYASQTHYQMYESDTSGPNITLQPGAQQFWFGEGNNGGGVRNIVYYAITLPYSPTDDVEFRATVMGAVNGTIFSTQSDYIQTSFTIPAGTREVNYTLVNPTQSLMTVSGAEVRFYDVSHPSMWMANLLTYVGIATILSSLVAVGGWFLMRRKGSVKIESGRLIGEMSE